jgi:transposase
MARGRTTSLTLTLSPQERRTLLVWERSTSIAGRARRARIILLVAEGMPISHIADTVGTSRRFVYKWVKRFLHARVAGLSNLPGRGFRSRAALVEDTSISLHNFIEHHRRRYKW